MDANSIITQVSREDEQLNFTNDKGEVKGDEFSGQQVGSPPQIFAGGSAKTAKFLAFTQKSR